MCTKLLNTQNCSWTCIVVSLPGRSSSFWRIILITSKRRNQLSTPCTLENNTFKHNTRKMTPSTNRRNSEALIFSRPTLTPPGFSQFFLLFFWVFPGITSYHHTTWMSSSSGHWTSERDRPLRVWEKADISDIIRLRDWVFSMKKGEKKGKNAAQKL